jgi:hypothetical protein
LVIQSWLGKGHREDRVMFAWQPSSRADQLTVRLPKGTLPEMVVRQRGEISPIIQADAENTVRIKASNLIAVGQTEIAPIPIELIYRVDASETLAPPRFGDDVWIAHSYWHLSIPSNEYLLWSSGELQSDNDWSWATGGERAPSVRLPELEHRVSAVTSPALPSTVNQYLFGGVGQPESLQIVRLPRSLVVGGASLLLLLTGMLFLSFPQVRKPAALLSVLVALAALVWIFPSITFILVRASLLAFTLIIVSGVLRWMLYKNRPGQGARRTWSDDSRASKSNSTDHGSTTDRTARSAVPSASNQ